MLSGLRHWEFFVNSAWFDLRLNYRRSFLGPIWITIVSGVHILVMGFVFGHLFGMRANVFFPWVAAGIILWNFATLFINEAATCLTRHRGYILEGQLPVSAYIMRDLVRSVLTLGHTIINYVIVAIVFQITPNAAMLLVLITFPIVLICIYPLGLIIALLTARFKDTQDLTQSVLTILFFATPVIWHPAQIKSPIVELILLNPASAILSMIRMPLLGQSPALMDMFITAATGAFFWMIALFLMGRHRYRIAFWV